MSLLLPDHVRRIRSVLGGAASCLLLSLACGGATDSDPTSGVGAAKAGCQSNADCGDGWCVGPAGCGSTWTCVSEMQCSAAAPFYVCDCSGRVGYRAAGCPGSPYDRRLDNLYDVHQGMLCPVDLRVRLEGAGFNGVRLRGELSPPGEPESFFEYESAVKQGTPFDLVFESSVFIDSAPQALFLWLDVDDDGSCDAQELSWTASVSSTVPSKPLELNVDLNSGAPCGISQN